MLRLDTAGIRRCTAEGNDGTPHIGGVRQYNASLRVRNSGVGAGGQRLERLVALYPTRFEVDRERRFGSLSL